MHTPSKHHSSAKKRKNMKHFQDAIHKLFLCFLPPSRSRRLLLITVQLPVVSIPTKYSHSAGCSHYELYIITSGRIGDPVWSMTSFYSKAFRDQDCEYSKCEAATVYRERAALRSWNLMHTVFRGMLNENDIQTFVILRHYRTMPRGRKPQKPLSEVKLVFTV